MKRKFDIIDLVLLLMIIVVIAYVSSTPVSAHESKIEKEQAKVINQVTENHNDELMILRNRLYELEKKVSTYEQQKALTEKEHQAIKLSIKPKPKAKPKPVRIPKYKLKQLINLYYAKNLSPFTIRCEFIAVHSKDDDHVFTLLKNETLSYKKRYRKKPVLKCRS